MQYKSPLLQSLQSNLRLQHLSRRTEAAYVYLILACSDPGEPVARRELLVARGNPSGLDLALINDAGEYLRILTPGGIGSEFDPAWSPDGRRIAFSRDESGSHDIWVMNADGSEMVNLTPRLGNQRDPDWSPDGEWIAFSDQDQASLEVQVAVMRSDGSDHAVLRHGTNPDWSPDGSRITYQVYVGEMEDTEVFVMDADGSGPVNLTDNSRGHDQNPQWSPDGRHIVYESGRTGLPQIWLMNADGSDRHALTRDPRSSWEPAWSPDGSEVAFSQSSDIWPDIFLIDADGGGPSRRMTHTMTGEYAPAWRP